MLAPDDSRNSNNVTPVRSASPDNVRRLNSLSFARLAAFRLLILSLLYFFALRISDLVCFRAAFAVRFVALTVRFSFRTARFETRLPARARLSLASFLSSFLVARLTRFRVAFTRFAIALLALARSFENLLFLRLRDIVSHRLLSLTMPFSFCPLPCSRPLLSCPRVLSVHLFACRLRELPAYQLTGNRLTQQRRFFKTLPRCRVE